MHRSAHGGRHELGQNFLHHRPTIATIVGLVEHTRGPLLEMGAGDGALTRPLAELGRPLTAIDIDEHRVRRLRAALPSVRLEHADALRFPLDAATIVGNIPFHLTTPILRRLFRAPAWSEAILLTQWEVARKRAGVGGSTMMTAQNAPWFTVSLHGRVPAWAFRPQPSVDGGILRIRRRTTPLVPANERAAYERFVSAAFTGAGVGMADILRRLTGLDRARLQREMAAAGIAAGALSRDLGAEQWSAIWSVCGGRRGRDGRR